MVGLATGSTRSRMTQLGLPTMTGDKRFHMPDLGGTARTAST
jgi:hypothetical protein